MRSAESQKKGMRYGARYTGQGAAGGGDDRGARSVHGRARLQIGGMARGGAHLEHVLHGCDAGGVEAQRLVERIRLLPRVETRPCVRREGYGSGGSRRWTTAAHAACKRGRGCKFIGGRTRGAAHVEHVGHVRDAGGVEAQQLVERRRALPRVERGPY
eukprot:scaffold37601_cov54-Phaeocystis_antarctica.AAC.1